MPETRTVALTDAERVNLLLAEVKRLRRSREQERETLNLERGERARERQLDARQYDKIDRECDRWAGKTQEADMARLATESERTEALAAAGAANDALRAALKTAERERVDAQVLQYTAEAECEQLRRDLAAIGHEFAEYREMAEHAHQDRPSPVCSLSLLVGVAIGAGLVGVVAGASVGAEIVGRLPW